jgi:uncharacterized OsmC-like protein
MTLQMYARRKGYPLEEVAVDVEHNRVHAQDCEKCEQEREGLIDVMQMRIVVRGPLTDEQRDDLLRVAARCPVHKTLKSAPEIFHEIEVVD